MSKILVAGDILIDRYVKVSDYSRWSQENTRVPVYDVLSGEEMLGGAGHVAAAIRKFDPEGDHEVFLAGIMDDRFVYLTEAAKVNALYGDGRSLIKTRFHTSDTSEGIVFRVDEGLKFDPKKVENFVDLFEEQVEDIFDVLVVSDYDKGTITERFVEVLKKRCMGQKIVDSKRKDLRVFEGFDVLSINQDEYSEQRSNRDYVCPESLFKNVVVTQGGEGADLLTFEAKGPNNPTYIVHREHFPTVWMNPVDVTGCGDIHTAATAYCFAEGRDLRTAVKFANGAAGQAVKQFGTSRVKS